MKKITFDTFMEREKEKIKKSILLDVNVDEINLLFDAAKWTQGYYRITDGAAIATSTHRKSLKILIKPGANYYIKGVSGVVLQVVSWKKDGYFHSSLGEPGSTGKTYTIPKDARYLGVYLNAPDTHLIDQFSIKEVLS